MHKLDIRKYLKSACKPLLEDLYEKVGFDEFESKLFKEVYLKKFKDKREKTCCILGCGSTKFKQTHNNILDKIESYLNFISK